MVSQLCVQPFRSSTPGRSQFVYVVPNAASAELPASLPRGSTDDSVIVSLPGYSAMNVTSDLPTALLRGTIARGQTNGASVMDSGIAPLFLRSPCQLVIFLVGSRSSLALPPTVFSSVLPIPRRSIPACVRAKTQIYMSGAPASTIPAQAKRRFSTIAARQCRSRTTTAS